MVESTIVEDTETNKFKKMKENIENEIKIIENNINIEYLYNNFLMKYDNINYNYVDELNDTVFQGYKSLLNLNYVGSDAVIHDPIFFINNAKYYDGNSNKVIITAAIAGYTTPPDNFLIHVNLANFYSKKLVIYNLYLDFLYQFYKEIDNYILTNYELDSGIYEHTFKFKLKYLINTDLNTYIIQASDKIIDYKLNKINIESKNIDSNLITILTDDKEANDTFISLLQNADRNDLLKNIDVINTQDAWRKNRNGFYEYKKIIVMFDYIILLVLYKYISNNSPSAITKLDDLVTHFYTSLDNNLKDMSKINFSIDRVLRNKTNSNDESKKIKNVMNAALELKKINTNLAIKSNKIKSMNKTINSQQSKLNKINIVLIIAIIIFIFIVACLILNDYISNNVVYISIACILLISLIIYIYIYNLKNTAYYIAENFINSDIKESLEKHIGNFKIACDSIKDKSMVFSESYYDIINPLLNIELKKYNEKSNNTKLYDKIASFNVNIGQRDIKFTIETIHYLVNLSVLFIVVLLLIKLNKNFKYLTIIIAFIIFTILTTLYFVKLVRVVRTKSNNYYLDKPKSLKNKL